MSIETHVTAVTHAPDSPLQSGIGKAPTAKKEPRFFVTESAVAEIKRQLGKRVADGKSPAYGLRVGIRGGGCTGFGYLFEWMEGQPRATDRVYAFDEGAVKVISDPKSLMYLDNTTLDFVTGLQGHGFKFGNPNVKGACGCGESVQF